MGSSSFGNHRLRPLMGKNLHAFGHQNDCKAALKSLAEGGVCQQRCDRVAQRLGNWTCDSKAVGSTVSRSAVP